MIQTFSADRADHAFHVSALPGRSRSAENFFDIHDFGLFAELLSVDPITISQQIFRCCVEGKGFENLLRSPFGRGMSCHVKVDDTSPIMRENDEDEQNFKPYGILAISCPSALPACLKY
jgi:hypothetical protein